MIDLLKFLSNLPAVNHMFDDTSHCRLASHNALLIGSKSTIQKHMSLEYLQKDFSMKMQRLNCYRCFSSGEASRGLASCTNPRAPRGLGSASGLAANLYPGSVIGGFRGIFGHHPFRSKPPAALLQILSIRKLATKSWQSS